MHTRNAMNQKRMRRARRVRAKVSGTAEKPRLSVFRSNRAFYAQLIDDAKGCTLAAATVKEVKGEKLTKSQAAEKIGTLLAEKAKKLGITKAIFDRGRYSYHGRVRACAESARKAGLTI